MAIKRTPAAPKPRGPKKAARTLGDRCAGCGVTVDREKVPFVMPSMFDPPEFACSKPCYDDWCEAHPPPTKLKG